MSASRDSQNQIPAAPVLRRYRQRRYNAVERGECFKRKYGEGHRVGQQPMKGLNREHARTWALVLLAFAILTAGSFVIYGLRSHFSTMFILGVVSAIFNLLLPAYVVAGPLNSSRELRDTLLSFFTENCFFIGGIFALAYDRIAVAGLAVVAGLIIHVMKTRKHVSRLRIRRNENRTSAEGNLN